MMWYYKVLIGAGAALVRIVYGWATRAKEAEPFDWVKAAKTLIAGVVSGGALGFFIDGEVSEIALMIFLGTVTLDDLQARFRQPK